MNLLSRRCGCGAIFALLHLRTRSSDRAACQRVRAGQFNRAHLASLMHADKQADRDRQQKAAQEFMRWATKKLEERERQAALAAAAVERQIERAPDTILEQLKSVRGLAEQPSKQARLGRGLAALARIREAKSCP
jgi:uncharacterized membrane protein YccC